MRNREIGSLLREPGRCHAGEIGDESKKTVPLCFPQGIFFFSLG